MRAKTQFTFVRCGPLGLGLGLGLAPSILLPAGSIPGHVRTIPFSFPRAQNSRLC